MSRRSFRTWRRAAAGALATVLVVLATLRPAGAQLQLHSPAGSPPSAAPGAGAGAEPSYAPPKPIVLDPPTVETIIGHALAKDGAAGAMTFEGSGNDLVLSKLTLTGDRISSSTKTCSVDVSLASPLALMPAGRPAGMIRYEAPLKACPFTIDVLDGSVLVSTRTPTCDLTGADCRVAPAGLWGPAAAEITDKRANELVRTRVRIESTMRADFRLLLKRAGKDREAVKALAREQAGFSSAREMACRDYAQESVHGFCSTQITEARVLALLTKLGDDKSEDRKHSSSDRARRNQGMGNRTPPRGASPATTPPSDVDAR